MSGITRRHLFAGAAATAACAAIRAATAIEAKGFDLDRFLEVAVAETKRLHPGVEVLTFHTPGVWTNVAGFSCEDARVWSF